MFETQLIRHLARSCLRQRLAASSNETNDGLAASVLPLPSGGRFDSDGPPVKCFDKWAEMLFIFPPRL